MHIGIFVIDYTPRNICRKGQWGLYGVKLFSLKGEVKQIVLTLRVLGAKFGIDYCW